MLPWVSSVPWRPLGLLEGVFLVLFSPSSHHGNGSFSSCESRISLLTIITLPLLTTPRAMLGTVVFGLSTLAIPSDNIKLADDASIDWIGAYLGIGGLILFNFVWK